MKTNLMSATTNAVRKYKLKAAILPRLNQLFDRLSPGWGFRRRFGFVDQWIRKIEQSGRKRLEHQFVTSLERSTTEEGHKPLLGHVRYGPVRFQLALSSREAITTSWLTRAILLDNVWEPVTTRLFCELLNPGDVVLDVGANVGYYSILSGKLVGSQGKVVAFEPDAYSYRLLCENIRSNGLTNVVLPMNRAVGERAGGAKLFLSGKDSGDHRLFDPGDGRVESVEVECIRIDEFLLQSAQDLMERIKLIKMDVQGFEVAAYKGMSRFLSQSKAQLITEYEPCTLAQAGTSAEEYLTLLDRYGYREFSFISWNPKQQIPERVTRETLLSDPCTKDLHPRHGYLYCVKRSTDSQGSN